MALVPYEIPDFNARIEEIITTQFRDQPVIHKHLRMWVEELEELGITFQSLAQDRAIDNATGDVLDIIGRIVGQERTIVGADLYDFFGFRGHIQALGFGDTYVEGVGGRWWSLGAPMGGDVTLTDEQYRQVIKARIMRNNSRGTCEDMLAYIRFVFGVDGKFTWNEGAVARVGVGRKLTNFEKALIAAEFSFQRYPTYYSPKPLGVTLELFEYDSLGTLGFIGTPNAKGMIVLSDPAPDGGIFASVKYFDELPPQPPAYEVDFSKDQSFPAELNFSRAGTAYAFNANGVLTQHAANIPRMEYDPRNGEFLGLLLEEARTNMVPRSDASGAVLGVVGSGGVMPTGWSVTPQATSGFTSTITKIEVEDGLPMVEINFKGTSLVGYQGITFGNITGWAANTFYGASLFMCFVGTPPAINPGAVQFQARYNISGGSVNITGNYSANQLNTRLRNHRLVANGTTQASVTGSGQLLVVINTPVGSTHDFTVRVALPQLEVGTFSSPIITSGITVTRAADNCKTSALTLPNDGYTAYVEFKKHTSTDTYPVMFGDNPTALGNYAGIRSTPTSTYLNSTEGGRSNGLPTQPVGSTVRSAFCVSNNMALNRYAQNGELSIDRVNNLPTVNLGARNILKLGTVVNTVGGLWHIKKYSVYTVPFSAEQLNYLTYVT